MSATSELFRLGSLSRPASLGELAYRSLRDAIIRGAFAPGHKFTVRSVADALGVSTTPARDAINRLLAEGALYSLGPKTVVLPVLSMEALDEITAIRLQLEGFAAEKGTPHVSEADTKRLAKIQLDLNKALDAGKYTRVLEINKDFHFTVYGGARMPRLLAIIESLWLRIGPSLNALYPEYAVSRRGVSNHETVLRGLQERDGAMVRSGFEGDIRDGYKSLHAYVRKMANAASGP